MSRVVELFGKRTTSIQDWEAVVGSQLCPYNSDKCFKTRKSEPSVAIGTCTIYHGRTRIPLIICPNRFLADGGQVFIDILHLLTLHEPGNYLHLVPEVYLPGGSVDYMLVSVNQRKVVDFVGVELQSLDTTGTVWPHRQSFLRSQGVEAESLKIKPMGINWKMTAKTILLQLHHKVRSFESVGRRLVLVLQQDLMKCMSHKFTFDHLEDAKLGNTIHFHPYRFVESNDSNRLTLTRRYSTDARGISKALELRQDPLVDLSTIVTRLQSRIGPHTRFVPVHAPVRSEL